MKSVNSRQPQCGGSVRFRIVLAVFLVALLSGVITSVFFLLGGYLQLLPWRSVSSATLVLALFFCSVPISVVLSVLIATYAAKPFTQIGQASERIAKGDFSARVEVGGDDHSEIGNILHSFNHMAEELSNVELFRNDFINNFSHEFKTPIVSIRGFAKRLENDELTEEQRREYIHIIFDESERLSRMSENILLLTKLENQQIISDRTSFYLDEQIRKCVLLLQRQWEEKEIDLQLDLEELPYYSNEEMLSHVWINLFNNAIKFTPKGGTITFSMHKEPNRVLVCITDTGCGMSEEVRRHIFEKFYQGDQSHSMKGNGIGLTITQRIVTLCGGTVSVDSTPGQGSCFVVSLPLTAIPGDASAGGHPAYDERL